MKVKYFTPIVLGSVVILLVIIYTCISLKWERFDEGLRQNTRIDVLCMVRNSSRYVQYLRKVADGMKETYPNYLMKFHFFENNSTDDTVEQCNRFLRHHRGVLYSDHFENNHFGKFEQSKRRMLYMAKLRRIFKSRVGRLRSKYVCLLDTDTVFNVETIHDMIATMERDKTIGAVTPFTEDSGTQGHYFDTLAMKINGKSPWPKCPFEGCSSCNFEQPISPQGIIDVDSAFGGLCVLYSEYFKNVITPPMKTTNANTTL